MSVKRIGKKKGNLQCILLFLCLILGIGAYLIRRQGYLNSRMMESEREESGKVVGYYASWEPNKLDRIRYDVLTHINYAFAIPTIDGGILPLAQENLARRIIREAHEKGVKVFIAVGGWSYEDTPLENTFEEATKTKEKITSLVNSICTLVKEYGFDGVDIDWEYPNYQTDSQRQYEVFIECLSEKIKQEHLLLSVAVLGGLDDKEKVETNSLAISDIVINSVDWINIMAYDMCENGQHSSYEFAINCATYWKDIRNVSKEKIVLGVPFYGRNPWMTYDEIVAYNRSASCRDRIDRGESSIYYNGLNTIQKKAEWAKSHIGGIMVWEISQDTKEKETSLLWKIGEVMKD